MDLGPDLPSPDSSPPAKPGHRITSVFTNGHKEIQVSDAQRHAYDALQAAAERIGAKNFRRLGPTQRNRQGHIVGGYYVTAEHAAVVAAMPQVLSGEMSPDEALSLLRQYAVVQQRLG